MSKISIGSDHGGFEYKEAVKRYLSEKGHMVIDVGTDSTASCHYPEFSRKAAELVANGVCQFGILICTSGEGISIAANKVKGVRCGIGYNDDVSHLMREHNHCNMIAFGQKFMELDDVIRRIELFLNAEPQSGRHDIRVQMIEDMEK